MKNILFLFFLLAAYAQAFDKGEEFFEQKKYTEAVKTFLTQTPITDPRVYPFLSHVNQQKLIEPSDLGDQDRREWETRLQHLSCFSKGVFVEEVYLQIALAAQDLYSGAAVFKTIQKAIQSLCERSRVGFGYYVLGRFLESHSHKTTPKKKYEEVISFYEKGAEYGDSQSVMALGRVKELNLSGLSFYSTYQQEYRYLRDQQGSLGNGEKSLSRLYSTGAKSKKYGVFSTSSIRKTYWQLEAARKGGRDLQLMLVQHAAIVQSDIGIICSSQEHWLYFAALGGDPHCQTHLGQHLFGLVNDSPFSIHIPQAHSWFEKSIAFYQVNPERQKEPHFLQALKCAGNILELGKGGVVINLEQAFTYYKQGADLFHDTQALFNTSVMINNSRGTTLEHEAAKPYLEEASKLGDGNASRFIGLRLLTGTYGYGRNVTMGYAYLLRGATQKDPESRWELYGIHAHIRDDIKEEEYPVDKDLKVADDYLWQAAQGGHEQAQQRWVSNNFERHNTLPADKAKILVDYLKAHAPRSAKMKGYLAILTNEGYRDLIDQDEAESVQLFQEAAEANDQLACFYLGYGHEHGLWGLDQSYEKAAEFYRRAPDSPSTTSNLGFLHQRGYGVGKDIKEAVRLYELALSNRFGGAANNLGALHQNGLEVPQNHALAVSYYKQGWALGDPDASLMYAQYLYLGESCDKNWDLARQILLTLDENNPHVALLLGTMLLAEDFQMAMQKIHQASTTNSLQAQYIYGLLLYRQGSQASSEDSKSMITEAIKWLKAASDSGYNEATSALRILQRNYENHESGLGPLIKSLLKRDFQKAREISQVLRQQVTEEKEEKVDLATDAYVQQLEVRDLDAAKKREEERLEAFLDPKNRKSISVQDLQQITGRSILQKGGYAKSTKGSGNKLKVGDQVLSFHHMHRSGQSTRTTLDPGRAKDFQAFAQSLRGQDD